MTKHSPSALLAGLALTSALVSGCTFVVQDPNGAFAPPPDAPMPSLSPSDERVAVAETLAYAYSYADAQIGGPIDRMRVYLGPRNEPTPRGFIDLTIDRRNNALAGVGQVVLNGTPLVLQLDGTANADNSPAQRAFFNVARYAFWKGNLLFLSNADFGSGPSAFTHMIRKAVFEMNRLRNPYAPAPRPREKVSPLGAYLPPAASQTFPPAPIRGRENAPVLRTPSRPKAAASTSGTPIVAPQKTVDALKR
jgi:hypothetical protein